MESGRSEAEESGQRGRRKSEAERRGEKTFMKRTHHCSELRATHIGQKVCLCGWVHVYRDHGGIVFIDLRDREGITQIVFDPHHNKPSADLAHELRSEFVIEVEGAVRKR